jgi:predicted ATPase
MLLARITLKVSVNGSSSGSRRSTLLELMTSEMKMSKKFGSGLVQLEVQKIYSRLETYLKILTVSQQMEFSMSFSGHNLKELSSTLSMRGRCQKTLLFVMQVQ